MSRIAYVNGRYVPHGDASVHIEDRGYQFADGVYEVVHLQDGRLIDETLHLDRLDRSLRELRITPPMSRSALRQVMLEVVRRNRLQSGLIYMQVTRGVAKRDHAFPAADTKPSIVVTARRIPGFPTSADAWAGRAVTHPDLRWARCDIKTVGLLPNVLAKQAARERGAAEAILVDENGMVTEGSSTSVWIVDASGALRTRHLDHAILPGVTRAALKTLAEERQIRVEERAFTADELASAREAFITSATSFVRPLTMIDDRPVGDGTPGPVTRRLFDLFAEHVRGA
jgi:D-alanine transaminase